jgi:hypothetical protein
LFFGYLFTQNAVKQVEIEGLRDVIIKAKLSIYLVNIGITAQCENWQMRIAFLYFPAKSNAVGTAQAVVEHHHMWFSFVDQFKEFRPRVVQCINLEAFQLERRIRYLNILIGILYDNGFHRLAF